MHPPAVSVAQCATAPAPPQNNWPPQTPPPPFAVYAAIPLPVTTGPPRGFTNFIGLPITPHHCQQCSQGGGHGRQSNTGCGCGPSSLQKISGIWSAALMSRRARPTSRWPRQHQKVQMLKQLEHLHQLLGQCPIMAQQQDFSRSVPQSEPPQRVRPHQLPSISGDTTLAFKSRTISGVTGRGGFIFIQ